MSLPTIEPISDDDDLLPPARRRRQRRMIVPPESGERAEFLRELSLRVVPSFDFFLFSLLSGLTLCIGLMLDAPALIFLSVLFAPFMAPVIGISLGTITGSVRFVIQSLISLMLGSLIIFLSGMLAGWGATLLPERVFQQAAYHTQFTWPDFIVLVLGAGLATYLMVRAQNNRPLVASVAIAYTLYLPVGAAGFGLVRGLGELWPAGIFLFLVHLVWAALVGTVVLAVLGLRPLNATGYLFSLLYAAVGVFAIVLYFTNPPEILLPAALQSTEQASGAYVVLQPSPTRTATATITPSLTPVPATASPTPTRTLVPSLTASATITPVPTPVWAKIVVSDSTGARIRTEPNFDSVTVTTILNDALVEIIPAPNEDTSSGDWVYVRTLEGKEGWIVRALIRTATPVP